MFTHTSLVGINMVCGLQDDKLAAELNDIQDVEVCDWAGVCLELLP